MSHSTCASPYVVCIGGCEDVGWCSGPPRYAWPPEGSTIGRERASAGCNDAGVLLIEKYGFVVLDRRGTKTFFSSVRHFECLRQAIMIEKRGLSCPRRLFIKLWSECAGLICFEVVQSLGDFKLLQWLAARRA